MRRAILCETLNIWQNSHPFIQIPWSHNVAILDKVKGAEQREWYILKTAENGWSHSVLVHQIESDLYERQVIAEKVSNFEKRLPSPQNELAVQTMNDPYIFDLIPFAEDMFERDIEQAVTFCRGYSEQNKA